ncbi:MAG: hypothetical protein R2776_01200 [Flavobacteriaceae bacterium]|nr:hypothetical protein [Flavobacteriaceae bacterium]
MRNSCLLFIGLLFGITLSAQVGINTTTPDASASLDIESTNTGILIPRMTQVQKNTIATPATGLLIYQTDGINPGFYFYNGTGWDYLTANGAKEINDLSDGNTSFNSLFLGDGIAASATAASTSNIAIGDLALRHLTDGDFNVAIGPGASENIRSGSNNISIGLSAMSRNRTGNDNIGIGNFSGLNSDIAATGNIFIGTWAGFSELGSNKLYIENSLAGATGALIYGEFDNDILRTNGEFQIGNPTVTGYRFPTSDGASGEVLTTNGTGTLSWQSTSNPQIAFRATASAFQTITGNSSAILQFDTETFDLQNNYNPTTYTFTAPSDGLYRINAVLRTSSNTQFVFFDVQINGTIYVESNDTSPFVIFDTLAELNANDLVTLHITTTNASSAGVFSNIYINHSYFEIVKIN